MERAQQLPFEVEAVTASIVKCASETSGSAAVALVGSWARGVGRPDSDVDIVLLTERPELWLHSGDALRRAVPGALLVGTRDFGALQERRLRLPSGLEVEICIGRPSWAFTSTLDRGTRRVASDGLRSLWDPFGHIAALLAAIEDDP